MFEIKEPTKDENDTKTAPKRNKIQTEKTHFTDGDQKPPEKVAAKHE